MRDTKRLLLRSLRPAFRARLLLRRRAGPRHLQLEPLERKRRLPNVPSEQLHPVADPSDDPVVLEILEVDRAVSREAAGLHGGLRERGVEACGRG